MTGPVETWLRFGLGVRPGWAIIIIIIFFFFVARLESPRLLFFYNCSISGGSGGGRGFPFAAIILLAGAPNPDDYLTLPDSSRKLKAAGHPCGQALSNTNDGNHNWRSVLYSFGGTETFPDGKTITINSPETLAALKYGQQLYADGMTDEVVAWDDSSNNLLILSGRGAWIDNATSAYITAATHSPDIFPHLEVALNPKGPGDKGGRRNTVDPNAWAT